MENRLVIHLQIKQTNHHAYYGSIQALYSHYSKEELGVAAQTLYNQWKDGAYENDKVVIRKGRLFQKSKLVTK